MGEGFVSSLFFSVTLPDIFGGMINSNLHFDSAPFSLINMYPSRVTIIFFITIIQYIDAF